jgi:hypothetical protein
VVGAARSRTKQAGFAHDRMKPVDFAAIADLLEQLQAQLAQLAGAATRAKERK